MVVNVVSYFSPWFFFSSPFSFFSQTYYNPLFHFFWKLLKKEQVFFLKVTETCRLQLGWNKFSDIFTTLNLSILLSINHSIHQYCSFFFSILFLHPLLFISPSTTTTIFKIQHIHSRTQRKKEDLIIWRRFFPLYYVLCEVRPDQKKIIKLDIY